MIDLLNRMTFDHSSGTFHMKRRREDNSQCLGLMKGTKPLSCLEKILTEIRFSARIRKTA